MNFQGALTISILTLAAIVFAVFAVEARSLVRSMYWYIVHSCCLIVIYCVYAVVVDNPYLFIWAGLCVVNTWILPFLKGGLKYTAKRIPPEKASLPLGRWVLITVAICSAISIGALSRFQLVVRGNPIEQLSGFVSVNLFGAVMLFAYGIIVLVTRRHLFKLAIGLLVMTAGAHLTLVQVAPHFFTMVEIEILTKVMGTVFAMLYAVRLLAERYQTTDAEELLRPGPSGGANE